MAPFAVEDCRGIQRIFVRGEAFGLNSQCRCRNPELLEMSSHLESFTTATTGKQNDWRASLAKQRQPEAWTRDVQVSGPDVGVVQSQWIAAAQHDDRVRGGILGRIDARIRTLQPVLQQADETRRGTKHHPQNAKRTTDGARSIAPEAKKQQADRDQQRRLRHGPTQIGKLVDGMHGVSSGALAARWIRFGQPDEARTEYGWMAECSLMRMQWKCGLIASPWSSIPEEKHRQEPRELRRHGDRVLPKAQIARVNLKRIAHQCHAALLGVCSCNLFRISRLGCCSAKIALVWRAPSVS
jgi:hypothetical protein